MNYWFRILSAFFVLFFVTTSAYAVPKKMILIYEVKRDGKLFANVTETFSQDGKSYSIQSVAKGIGIYALLGERKLISRGEVTKAGLQPIHFESLQSKKASKALINDFDWKNHVLNMQIKGEQEQQPLETGTQDLLSIMYQFMFVPPKGSMIKVPVTIGKKLRTHEYQVKAKPTLLNTRAGSFKAIELANAGNPEEKKIYLAVDQRYIPVKIELREDDATIEQIVTKVKFE